MTHETLSARRVRLKAECSAQRAAMQAAVLSIPAPRDLLSSLPRPSKPVLIAAGLALGLFVSRPRKLLALIPAAAGLWKLARPLLETIRQASSAAAHSSQL
ncbi:hypothetical protein E4L96_23350 [Massilia arenosa]|uniref:Uncharacterized protein n=1 Tax=Zemynaea arenosa TaxID=2561931 RepID=A0A4Y9RMY8_9BURK|nr:hypothetical protein [Massilia arenosa]TFW10647.1 hypothetical protein E4L96_23350 [Massilia arenosa]